LACGMYPVTRRCCRLRGRGAGALLFTFPTGGGAVEVQRARATRAVARLVRGAAAVHVPMHEAGVVVGEGGAYASSQSCAAWLASRHGLRPGHHGASAVDSF
jgi:hypothetical protein